MLRIHHSNKIEVLAAQLNTIMLTEPLPGLLSEQVLLESAAMSHWLLKNIASNQGIAANLEFPFPAALLWRLYRKFLPDLPELSRFDRLPVALNLLPALTLLQQAHQLTVEDLEHRLQQINMPAALWQQLRNSALAAYCQALHKQADVYLLAEHIACLFDQYQIYRPDFLQHWQHKARWFAHSDVAELEAWQATLWLYLNQLGDQANDPNRADIFTQLLQCLDRQIAQLPEGELRSHLQFADLPRLHCFALSNLPASYLQVYSRLAAFIDVHFYVLNPSVEFWLDAKTRRSMLLQQRSNNTEALPINAVPMDAAASLQAYDNASLLDSDFEQNYSSNAFLALLAKQHQAMLLQLLDCDNAEVQQCFVETEATSLLHQLQNRLTRLESGRPIALADQWQQSEQSMLLHSCHNRLREVEVLQQTILQQLDNNPDWDYHDIAVVVPNIDDYSEYFHAVFAANHSLNKAMQLPYAVAEKNSQQQALAFAALNSFIEMLGSQYKHSHVVQFLQHDIIAHQFDLDAEQLAEVEKMLLACNVRFGLHDQDWHQNGDHGKAEALVPLSFEQAKRRLIQSFFSVDSLLMHAEYEHEFIANIEHERADIAGKLIEFIDQLSEIDRLYSTKIQATATLQQHLFFIERVLQRLFSQHTAFEFELQLLRDSLQKLSSQFDLVTPSGQTISFSVFKRILSQSLQAIQQSIYFVEAKINISSLLPMQSVPFKMIAVLGLNDGDFPQLMAKDQLDLMQHFGKLGDRNKLDEQRAQFLQAILSTRECFYMSYLGRNQYDNSEQFPSLLLVELLQFLDDNFTDASDKNISEHLTVQQPLQAFDAAYFLPESSLCNFNPAHFAQAKALLYKQYNMVSEAVFADSKPLQTASDTTQAAEMWGAEIHLSQIIQAFSNSSKAYLTRLGVHLQAHEYQDIDTENFQTEGLDYFKLLQLSLKHQLLDTAQSKDSKASESLLCSVPKSLLVQHGLLPQAAAGAMTLSQLETELTNIQRLLHYHHLQLKHEAHNFQCKLTLHNGRQVQLSFSTQAFNQNNGQNLYSITKTVRGKHMISAFLQHLALSIAMPEKSVRSYLLSLNQVYKIEATAPEHAETLLLDFIDQAELIYQYGQPLFIHSAFELMQSAHQKSELDSTDFKKLEDNLWGSERRSGELADIHHEYLYRGQSISLDAITTCAEQAFSNLFDYLTILDPPNDQRDLELFDQDRFIERGSR